MGKLDCPVNDESIMTFGEIFTAALPYLEGLIALILGGGWYKTWRTMKAAVKAADLDNEASAVALLEKDIERKNNEIKQKDEKIAILEDKVESKNTVIENKDIKLNKAARQLSRVSNVMCVHLGCIYRDPQLGAGMKWFEANEDDFQLATDFLTIEELMAQKRNNRTNKQD